MQLTTEQILKIGESFDHEALKYDERSIRKSKYNDNNYILTGNIKLDKINLDVIELYWDITINYIIIALRKVGPGFNNVILARFVINAKFPLDYNENYLQYKSIYDLFIKIVNDVLTPKSRISE